MNNILYLDLGSKTGYCVTDRRFNRIHHGVKDFTEDKKSGAGAAFSRFRDWLLQMVNGTDVGKIYFEDVKRHNGQLAGRIYYGLTGHLEEICYRYSVLCVGVGVGTIKKGITGNGAASKEKVIRSVFDKTKIIVKDDNHADAIALAYYVEHLYNGEDYDSNS